MTTGRLPLSPLYGTAFLAQFPVGEEPGYKAGSTYILWFAQRGFIAGSHSVCAVRTLLRVDRKIISIRLRRNPTEWFKSSHLIPEVLFNIALYPDTSPTGNCANPFNIASYPGSSPVFLQGRSLGMRLCWKSTGTVPCRCRLFIEEYTVGRWLWPRSHNCRSVWERDK